MVLNNLFFIEFFSFGVTASSANTLSCLILCPTANILCLLANIVLAKCGATLFTNNNSSTNFFWLFHKSKPDFLIISNNPFLSVLLSKPSLSNFSTMFSSSFLKLTSLTLLKLINGVLLLSSSTFLLIVGVLFFLIGLMGVGLPPIYAIIIS